MASHARVVGSVFNKTIAGATTDVFDTDITPAAIHSNGLAANAVGDLGIAYRLTISLDTAVKVVLNLTCSDTTIEMPFNSDVALVVNAIYTFSFSVPPRAVEAAETSASATSINLQLSAGAVVNMAILEEVYGAVL